ncbi:MAG: hypothetical protein ACHQ1E_11735 [Ktedonobacterales bacterium]|jgi:hypothetical protein
MPQDTLDQIAFLAALALLVALFVAGYMGLMRLFRRRSKPQPVTLTQRWLAAFIPVTPLCIFAAYFLFRAQPAATLDSLGFGVLGALAAATSSTSISSATRGAPSADLIDEAAERAADDESFLAARLSPARQRSSSSRGRQ